MISDPKSLYVWMWLPGQSTPVVAGQVVRNEDTQVIHFGYGRSFRNNPRAFPIFTPDLPLQEGLTGPAKGHLLAPSLRDALPDRWGRRVIVNDILGHRRDEINEDAFGEMTFMIKSEGVQNSVSRG